MKYMIFMFSLISACGAVHGHEQYGLEFDEILKDCHDDALRLVQLQAEAFGDSSWPEAFSGQRIVETSMDSPFQCDARGPLVEGCTTLDPQVIEMKLFVASADAGAVENTAFGHEATHIFLFLKLGDHDPEHVRSEFWNANDLARHRMATERANKKGKHTE